LNELEIQSILSEKAVLKL